MCPKAFIPLSASDKKSYIALSQVGCLGRVKLAFNRESHRHSPLTPPFPVEAETLVNREWWCDSPLNTIFTPFTQPIHVNAMYDFLSAAPYGVCSQQMGLIVGLKCGRLSREHGEVVDPNLVPAAVRGALPLRVPNHPVIEELSHERFFSSCGVHPLTKRPLCTRPCRI